MSTASFAWLIVRITNYNIDNFFNFFKLIYVQSISLTNNVT